MDLYVDGKEVGSGTADTTPISYGLPTTNDLSIGNYPVPTANFPDCGNLAFSGKIDEVHVFNRALGAQEVHLGYVASGYLPQQFPTTRSCRRADSNSTGDADRARIG